VSDDREQRVVVLSAVRTGFGSFGGTLRNHSATDLGVVATQCALARSGLSSEDIGHVVFGNVIQTSTDAAYLARHIGLRAGLPLEVPAVTINRLCGSGFEAIVQGAHRILLGEASAVITGGTESMSQAPYVLRGARFGTKLGQAPALEDSLWDSLRDTQCGLPMGETAENLGRQYGVTRVDADAYALASQQRAKAAWDAGVFRQEVIAVRYAIRKPGRSRSGPPTSTCGRIPLPMDLRSSRRYSARKVSLPRAMHRGSRMGLPRSSSRASDGRRPGGYDRSDASSAGPWWAWTPLLWGSAPRPRSGRRWLTRSSRYRP
jgi:hypothetical protein